MTAFYTSTGTTWSNWTSTAATTTTGDIYFAWVDEGTAATTTSADGFDNVWAASELMDAQPVPPHQIADIEKRAKARSDAVTRARKLLVDSLTPEQKKDYDKDMSFIVFGQKTKNKYRINHGRVGNVHLLNPGGGAQRRYCAHPAISVPNEDTMLAQKLMLETDEEDFLRLANVS